MSRAWRSRSSAWRWSGVGRTGRGLHKWADQDEVEEAEHEQRTGQPESYLAEFTIHQLGVITGGDPNPAKDACPEGGTEQGKNGIDPIVQPDDAGWDADEMADHWQEAGEEDAK